MWVLLLSALALEGGYLALNRLDNFKQFSVEYIAISLVTFPFYLVACWRVGEKEPTRRRAVLVGVVLGGVGFRPYFVGLSPSPSPEPFPLRLGGETSAVRRNPVPGRPSE